MQWVIFADRDSGQELFAYTVQGAFSDELEATAALIAEEKGKKREDIAICIKDDRRAPK